MEKIPNSLEQNTEDIYSDPYNFPNESLIVDYWNDVGPDACGVGEDGKIYRTGRIITVEERYITGPSSKGYGKPYKKIPKVMPKRVERINKLVPILNETEDVILFKRAKNEASRLIWGRQKALPYLEPEFDPNLLEI